MGSVFSFWWKCLKRAWGRAWGLFGYFRAVAYFVVAGCAVFGGYGLARGYQATLGFRLSVGPVCLFLLWLVWQLMRAPYDLLCEERNESEASEQSLKQEAQGTVESLAKELESSRAELRSLKDDKTPLEFIYRNRKPYVNKDVFMSRFLVGLVNKGTNKSARNVSLKLVSMEPPPKAQYIPLPIKLNPKPGEAETINPKAESLFDLLIVDYTPSKMEVILPGGQAFAVEGNKRYILTLQASCESSPCVEMQFELSFDMQKEPHATLTPVI